jgi:rhodanese-related sulfurtransferase
MTKVDVDEVAERLNRAEDITIIDSRSEDAWNGSDIKAGGAIRIPPDEAEDHIADVRRDMFAVTYCTWPEENSSTRVALALEDHGFTDVHPLIGGFDAWKEAGLPVEPK